MAAASWSHPPPRGWLLVPGWGPNASTFWVKSRNIHNITQCVSGIKYIKYNQTGCLGAMEAVNISTPAWGAAKSAPSTRERRSSPDFHIALPSIKRISIQRRALNRVDP